MLERQVREAEEQLAEIQREEESRNAALEARREQERARLDRIGMDNVRNITGSPIAGIDPHELLDTRPLCHGERSMLQTATCVPCTQPRGLTHAALACSAPASLQ